MTLPWPFRDPPNRSVITLERILRGATPILYVRHDRDDAIWQFLDGEAIAEGDAIVVSFSRILRADRSLTALCDLPLGWHAWRPMPGAVWEQAALSDDPEEPLA